jgi:hypothetical protein
LPAASAYFRDDQKLFFRFVRNSTRSKKHICSETKSPLIEADPACHGQSKFHAVVIRRQSLRKGLFCYAFA